MEKEIVMDKVENVDICFNTIRISGYKKGLFGRKSIDVVIGRNGIMTNIIDREFKLRYPRDKFLQSNAVKTILIGKEMNY